MKFKIGEEEFEDKLTTEEILKMGFTLANFVSPIEGAAAYIDGKGIILHHVRDWIDKGFSTNVAIQYQNTTMSQIPMLDRFELFTAVNRIRKFRGLKNEVES